KDLWDVLKKSYKRWNDANPWRQSAIIAYYAIFSMPALLLIVIYMAGYFYGEEAVSNQLSEQIQGVVGQDAANAVEAMVANAASTGSSLVAFWVGIAFLIFGATSVLYQLQLSLDHIWGVVPRPEKAFMKYLRDRFFSFLLILAFGLVLLLSLLLNSVVGIMGEWIKANLPDVVYNLIVVANYLIPLLLVAVAFALIFKVLPDAVIRWRSVGVGALLTALLFTLGQYLLGIYFREADPGSAYGAAGSIILLLVWISYVSMILLFGAEFTRQWAIKFGYGIRPKKNAEMIDFSKGNSYMSE
ncbi:MAG: YihY/virulence factor BrkB family protein, partial [Bacteroidales bacterium]